MHVTYLGRIGGLLVPPVLPLVRVGDVATNVWVIMREHATHAERHSMVSTPDNRAPTSTLLTRRVLSVPSSFPASKEPSEHPLNPISKNWRTEDRRSGEAAIDNVMNAITL
jgi:hypothetical protein